MEEETFHTISNKLSLTLNLPNLDKITIANDSSKNIESIDEEIIQASNHVNDDFYGVVWGSPFHARIRRPCVVLYGYQEIKWNETKWWKDERKRKKKEKKTFKSNCCKSWNNIYVPRTYLRISLFSFPEKYLYFIYFFSNNKSILW